MFGFPKTTPISLSSAGFFLDFTYGDPEPIWVPDRPDTVSMGEGKSHLFVSTSDEIIYGVYPWSTRIPGGVFDVRLQASLGMKGNAQYTETGLVILDSAQTSSIHLVWYWSSGGYSGTYCYQNIDGDDAIIDQPEFDWMQGVLRVTRDASNNVDYFVSQNGVAWSWLGRHTNNFIVSYIGVKTFNAPSSSFDFLSAT